MYNCSDAFSCIDTVEEELVFAVVVDVTLAAVELELDTIDDEPIFPVVADVTPVLAVAVTVAELALALDEPTNLGTNLAPQTAGELSAGPTVFFM